MLQFAVTRKITWFFSARSNFQQLVGDGTTIYGKPGDGLHGRGNPVPVPGLAIHCPTPRPSERARCRAPVRLPGWSCTIWDGRKPMINNGINHHKPPMPITWCRISQHPQFANWKITILIGISTISIGISDIWIYIYILLVMVNNGILYIYEWDRWDRMGYIYIWIIN
jgi:hypothetical protein